MCFRIIPEYQNFKFWKMSTLHFNETFSEAQSTYEKHFLCSDDWNLTDRFFIHRHDKFIMFRELFQNRIIQIAMSNCWWKFCPKVSTVLSTVYRSFETFTSDFHPHLLWEISIIRISKIWKLEFLRIIKIWGREKSLWNLLESGPDYFYLSLNAPMQCTR